MKNGTERLVAMLCFALIGVGCATGTITPQSGHQESKEAVVKPMELPEVQKFKLSNGMTVLIVENHQVPYAAFRMAFKTGSLQGQPERGPRQDDDGTDLRDLHKNGKEISQKVDSLAPALGRSQRPTCRFTGISQR